MKLQSEFSSCRTGEHFSLRVKFDCNTKNIIYLISCKKSKNVQYVGQTSDSIRNRFYQHRSNIIEKKINPLARHFYSDCSLVDLECMPIQKVVDTSVDERLDAETFWINKLKTSVPHGLNSDAFTYV